MSKKDKRKEQCKSWKDLREYAEGHGINYLYTNGGHDYYGNEKGKMPFETHEKEPSKHLRGQVLRQIAVLAKTVCLCFFVGYILLNILY